MRLTGKVAALTGIAALFLVSCFDPPEYSNVPAIEFESVSFVDVPDTPTEFNPDSLILVIRFKDGDGDLGLDANDPYDTLYPYHTRTFFDTIRNSPVGYYYPTIDTTYITYKTFRTDRYGWKPKLSFDTLPSFTKPYNCVNWDILSKDGVVDTFYFELNPYQYNIKVQFFVQQSNGDFKEFNWTEEFAYPQCGITLDGRFPILSKDLSRSAALDGRIRYSMPSLGFNFLFSIKTLKLRVTVFDRALNESNAVETPPFTLQQIKE